MFALVSRLFSGWNSGGGRAETVGDGGAPSFEFNPDGPLVVRRKARALSPFNWTSSGSTCAPTAWSSGASVSSGTVLRTAAGLYVLYQGSGTTGATAPAALGAQTDGAACYVVPEFAGGVTLMWSAGTPLAGSPGNPLVPCGTATGQGFDFETESDPSLIGLSGGTVVVVAHP